MLPLPMSMPVPMTEMEYARAYVLKQPYTCVVSPNEGLKWGTIFPFLLESYLPGLRQADMGVKPYE